jgi:hypothetical protein
MLTLCKHGPFLYTAGHKRFYEAANGKIRRAEPGVLRLGRVEAYLAGHHTAVFRTDPVSRSTKIRPRMPRWFPSTHPIV